MFPAARVADLTVTGDVDRRAGHADGSDRRPACAVVASRDRRRLRRDYRYGQRHRPDRWASCGPRHKHGGRRQSGYGVPVTTTVAPPGAATVLIGG